MFGVSAIEPVLCGKCCDLVFTARSISGKVIKLNAEPIVGGDYTIWPIGNGFTAPYLRCGARPEKALPPRRTARNVRADWDAYAEADRRPWFVEHQHHKTSEQIIEQRRMRDAS